MWGHNALTGLSPVFGTLVVPIWAVAAALALLVVLLTVAFMRAGGRGIAGAGLRAALVVVGAALAVLLFERVATQDAQAERRTLETRIAELVARALVPGSPLACLDGFGGDAVETACEKLVFANPETLAAATSYVAARLALLADASELARGTGAALAPSLDNLRLAAEADRFGLVSHVLAVRDGCTGDGSCAGLALLRNPARVMDNLRDRAFEAVLARHSGDWGGSAPAVAQVPPVASVPTVASSATASPPFFPSAASIPPVSIMNAEPTAPVAAPAPGTEPPPRRTPPPRRPAQAGPIQLAPATTGAEQRPQ